MVLLNPEINDLNEKLESMMEKVDGLWTCKVCGKVDKKNFKANVRNHIEAKHIEGVSHQCNHCGNSYRSRDSLRKHPRQNK